MVENLANHVPQIKDSGTIFFCGVQYLHLWEVMLRSSFVYALVVSRRLVVSDMLACMYVSSTCT